MSAVPDDASLLRTDPEAFAGGLAHRVTLTGATGPRPPDAVTGVALTDGRTLPADIVIIGIGATPNTDWLTGSTLTRRNRVPRNRVPRNRVPHDGVPHDGGVPRDGGALLDGIPCDDGCVTSLPHVVAVGDVAQVSGARAEHWTSATEQPRVAVANLLAGRTVETVRAVPYFWSDQYGTRLQFAGHRQDDDTVRIVEGDPAAPDGSGFLALYERAGRTTAVLAVNRPKPFRRVRRELTRAPGGMGASRRSV